MTPTVADQKTWVERLDGLPDDLRYTPLNSEKCPINPDTGRRRKQWQNFHYLPSDLDQMNGVVKAVGLHLGETSNGVMAVDFDGDGSETIFEQLLRKSVLELPLTVKCSSGRPGHYQCLYRVPKEYWPALSNKDFPAKHGPSDPHFELRWNGQSAIAGDHPNWLDPVEKTGFGQGPGDGFYSFAAGHSPKDRQIAVAPDWLLEFFQNECACSLQKQPKACSNWGQTAEALAKAELLYDISRTREIVGEWLHPADDHNSYITWTMVGMVCAYLSHAIGEPMLLFDLWND
ncbi:AAA domain protein [Synechococcus sp. RS9915]|nr:AAA domain protein [Synechococcus sp. RS9915]